MSEHPPDDPDAPDGPDELDEPSGPDGPPGPAAVAPVVRRRRAPARARRRRALGVAGGLAVLGALSLVTAFVVDEPVAVAVGAPPERVVATPVLSARRTPELTSRPVAERRLAESVLPVLAEAPADTCFTVRDGDQDVLAVQDDRPLVPASNLKVVVAAAALDLLGPDTTLTTRFAAVAPPAAGTVGGDLFVVGGGDPLLSTDGDARRFTNGPQPVTDLEQVADRVVAAGVRHITGSVVGDESRYDAQRAVPSWPSRHQAQGLVAPLSALLVNDGWTLDPVSGAGGAVAPDPAAHAAAVLTTLLQARGVQVDGPPRSGVAPEGTATVLDVASLPVRDLVAEMLTFSDNTTAELLVKELGATKGSAGTTAAGLAVVQGWLVDQGLPVEGVVLADGSGLSADNRVTCRLLADVLVDAGPDGELSTGLARPGRPGTLDDRFPGPEWRDSLRAKTGTLRSVTALSGWLSTVPGSEVVFGVVENTGAAEVTAQDLGIQNRLLGAVLAYPQIPPLDQLVPAPPTEPAGG